MIQKPAKCPENQFDEFKRWYKSLLKESSQQAKEAEKAFLSQWTDHSRTAPTEHIGTPSREDFGIKNELYRAVYVMKKSGGFGSESIARLLGISKRHLNRIYAKLA